MQHIKIHVSSDSNKVIVLKNGEPRRTPTNIIIPEEDKSYYINLFRKNEISDYTITVPTEEEIDKYFKKNNKKIKPSIHKTSTGLDIYNQVKG